MFLEETPRKLGVGVKWLVNMEAAMISPRTHKLIEVEVVDRNWKRCSRVNLYTQQ